jgi:hypothetical protein
MCPIQIKAAVTSKNFGGDMPQPVENLDKLDEHLKAVVQALHGAVKQGIPHTKEPHEVMAGMVKEWLN